MSVSVWRCVWEAGLGLRKAAEGLGLCMVALGVFPRSLGRAAGRRGPHLSGWPVETAPVQRAGAHVHVDLVHILEALPFHGNHLIS